MSGVPKRKANSVFLLFREMHHAVARMFAQGATISKVSRDTGYTRRRLHILLQDPAFQELIAEYAKSLGDKIEEVQDQFAELAVSNLLRAEAQLQEKLDIADEEGELLPTKELIAIVKDRADRFGYSAKRIVQHDTSFASRLDRAIEASDKAKVIEHQPSASCASPPKDPATAVVADARQLEVPQAAASVKISAPSVPPASGTVVASSVRRPSIASILRRGVTT